MEQTGNAVKRAEAGVPFHGPNGGTAMGGPSGDDEGQVFNMPITANIHTNVNDVNQDNHQIDVKNKNVHPPPVFAPVVEHHHRPGFEGPPPGFHRGGEHFHVPGTSSGKRWGPENGGTALGGPSNGHHHGGPAPGGGHNGGTAMGGPSGDDDGIDFDASNTANVHTNVNEFSKDDHSVHLKHKDIYPPPHHPAFVHAPPFKRGWQPEHGNGGTALGGPSGDDGGQTFSQSFAVNTHTNVNEAHKDDHSVHLKHKDVYPRPPIAPFHVGGPGPVVGGPFRRAYSPDRETGGGNGGTAMGGPSGDDGGVNFSQPNSVDVDSDVNEHHEDNHAIKADTTDIHPPPAPYHEVPQMPWLHYDERPHSHNAPPHEAPSHEAPHHEAPSGPRSPTQEAPAPIPEHHESSMQQEAPPQAPRHEQEQTPQCAAQVHEVVHTVTKTQYKEVQPTHTVYQQGEAHAAESSAVPMAHVAQSSDVPMEHGAQYSPVPMAHVAQTSAVAMPSGVDPKMRGSQLASAPAAASTPGVGYHSFQYNQQRPMSSGAAYSQIPVQVPMATPASSGYKAMMTPGASMGPMASGADPMHSAKASGSAAASPSASHGAMFTGAANTISGSLVSAAAAVVGVLAFVL